MQYTGREGLCLTVHNQAARGLELDPVVLIYSNLNLTFLGLKFNGLMIWNIK